MELSLLPLLTEMGLKPTEILILCMLWQNILSTRLLLDRLREKVNNIDE